MSVTVSGGISINLLRNGDNLNTTLNATSPLYQTFKKGTEDFNPNWATMQDSNRPIVFPRIRSVMEGRFLAPTDVSWKYNNVDMQFDGSGIATHPTIAAGKIRQIDYTHEGINTKALKIIGNVASDTNNDSDIITFSGNVKSSGQIVSVVADILLLVEEASNNLFRLFIIMADDVIDGDQTSIPMTAILYNNGSIMSSGVQYEFTDHLGNILRAKGSSGTFNVTREMIDSEMLVVSKAYVNNEIVAQEQKQVWDATDPYVIRCSGGWQAEQSASEDKIYTFSLLNQRNGNVVAGVIFDINVWKNADGSNITSEFAITNTSITITGAKIDEHESIYVDAECEV